MKIEQGVYRHKSGVHCEVLHVGAPIEDLGLDLLVRGHRPVEPEELLVVMRLMGDDQLPTSVFVMCQSDFESCFQLVALAHEVTQELLAGIIGTGKP